jgi:hypothetical protein
MSVEIENQENKNYYKMYYEKNKEQLQAKAKAKISCPLCDRIIAKASLCSHYKSKTCVKGQNIKCKKILIQNATNIYIDNCINEK